ncbi:MAG: polymerase sigma-70 factor, subfamily [Dehalococcoidia bacterium]|nr:polymerase sigma-70 factor, subfamily [Dehalococcoidia bacterium]
MPEEENLVQRAQQHDADAWAELYNRYIDRIYRYILARVRNTMLAEDLAEQVFLKALSSISSFTWRGGPFASWLFRIAHNLIIDYYRKPSSKEQPLPDWDLATSDSDPTKMAEINVTMETVLQSLQKLTAAQRQAIELRFIADLSVEETAKIMGKSQGAIKALQHSALESLRRLLSP